MKVKNLISKLQGYDEDLKVVFQDKDECRDTIFSEDLYTADIHEKELVLVYCPAHGGAAMSVKDIIKELQKCSDYISNAVCGFEVKEDCDCQHDCYCEKEWNISKIDTVEVKYVGQYISKWNTHTEYQYNKRLVLS